MNVGTEQDHVAAKKDAAIYLAMRIFILYALYALIPLFLVWTRSPTIELTPNTWSVPIFFIAWLLFTLFLTFSIRNNPLTRANELLGISSKSGEPRRHRGWKLAAQCAGLYCLLSAAIGFSYVMTGNLLLRVFPRPSLMGIPATLLSTHRGTGSRNDPCRIKNSFRTQYGNIEVCLYDMKKKIAMPDNVIKGESFILEGTGNQYVFVLDAVTRAPGAETRDRGSIRAEGQQER